MVRAYNFSYCERLQQSGTPTRRELAHRRRSLAGGPSGRQMGRESTGRVATTIGRRCPGMINAVLPAPT